MGFPRWRLVGSACSSGFPSCQALARFPLGDPADHWEGALKRRKQKQSGWRGQKLCLSIFADGFLANCWCFFLEFSRVFVSSSCIHISAGVYACSYQN